MASGSNVEEHVESILMNADRRVLKTLSPLSRCIILVLRVLGSRELQPEDIEAHVESYGFKCRNMSLVLSFMEYYGLLRCNNTCKLTDAGEELSSALREYLESMRSLAYSVIDGTVTENDIVANLFTSLASTLGFVDIYVEDPSLTRVYVPIHVYITGLAALVIAQLARVSAKVYDVVKRFLEEKI